MFSAFRWRCVLLVDSYASARPYLLHLTHRDNLNHIRELARLFPAAVLMERAKQTNLIRILRRGPRQVSFEGRIIVIRDQDKLHRGNTGIPSGYTFEDLIVVVVDDGGGLVDLVPDPRLVTFSLDRNSANVGLVRNIGTARSRKPLCWRGSRHRSAAPATPMIRAWLHSAPPGAGGV